ncbi:GCN5 family N-acetyltransferase [Cupriavidus sp. HPC(L)]|jgi:RimJ/RimL family protein N-acetyltransferase|uniref:GNAT family N-acetyltransferase n=1 Tax=Cupriavidus TaxID=106589 RepID=UPI0002919F1A|nr:MULTISPECIES: GNAT family N-acetyltransferase [Cupriavidus]ESJ25290.1 GCN5 family N-acetyltransferase [Cupriavidus sp. HPC(L)]MCT9072072.1 GNAT family N-acetyltransferase [Cupriavidus gilardii]QKS64405.1 GNAT family N-acetyltransferase [Cupriavidus gilardii]
MHPGPRPIQLETPRLIVRPWQTSDSDPFAALNADVRVMRYFPAPFDRAASDAMIDRCSAHIAAHGFGFWAVERKQDGAFIGMVGLNIPGAPLPFAPCVEIGWRLAAEYWGRGYASEAARAALRAGFEVFGLNEIVSFTALLNQPSQAVMERLGMRRCAQTFDHPNVPDGHPLKAHCVYRLTRADWTAVRQDTRGGAADIRIR